MTASSAIESLIAQNVRPFFKNMFDDMTERFTSREAGGERGTDKTSLFTENLFSISPSMVHTVRVALD